MDEPTLSDLMSLGCDVIGCDLDDDKIKRAVRPLLSKLARTRSELSDVAGALGGNMVAAFVQGAAWWEHEKEGATMWGVDKERAHVVAGDRLDGASLGACGSSYECSDCEEQ